MFWRVNLEVTLNYHPLSPVSSNLDVPVHLLCAPTVLSYFLSSDVSWGSYDSGLQYVSIHLGVNIGPHTHTETHCRTPPGTTEHEKCAPVWEWAGNWDFVCASTRWLCVNHFGAATGMSMAGQKCSWSSMCWALGDQRHPLRLRVC